jgi:hypothetical protein
LIGAADLLHYPTMNQLLFADNSNWFRNNKIFSDAARPPAKPKNEEEML